MPRLFRLPSHLLYLQNVHVAKARPIPDIASDPYNVLRIYANVDRHRRNGESWIGESTFLRRGR